MKKNNLIIFLLVIIVIAAGLYQFNRKRGTVQQEAVHHAGPSPASPVSSPPVDPNPGPDEVSAELNKIKEEKNKLEDELKTKEKMNASLSQLNTRLSEKVESIIKERDGLVLKMNTLLEEKKALEGKVASIPKGSFAQTLKDKAALEVELKKLKTNIDATRNLATEVSQAKSALETKFQELLKMREELEEKLKMENQVSDNLAETLAKEKRDSEAIRTKMSNVDQIVEEKLKKLDQIKNTLDEIAK